MTLTENYCKAAQCMGIAIAEDKSVLAQYLVYCTTEHNCRVFSTLLAMLENGISRLTVCIIIERSTQ